MLEQILSELTPLAKHLGVSPVQLLVGVVSATTYTVNWIWNAAVQSMPRPTPTDSKRYIWAFNFAHGLAGNTGLLKKVHESLRVPPLLTPKR